MMTLILMPIVVGYWMPIKVFLNDGKKLTYKKIHNYKKQMDGGIALKQMILIRMEI